MQHRRTMTGLSLTTLSRGRAPRIVLFAILVLLHPWSRDVDGREVKRTSYRAAVYEHAVIEPSGTTRPVPRSVAVQNMYKNLDVLEKQATLAKKLNADIFVFPEDGIYGITFTREGVYPYLESIPDPEKVTWSPCADPTRFPETEVQHRLSCVALHNNMYVVADMGDKVPCDKRKDPKCPEDGRYQYNTNVAYDPIGTLVAKYHKRHLYSEDQFDTPEVEIRYFDTPFGRFGLMVCFDILFHDPAVSLVTRHNVTDILFPTAWMDFLPHLSAIGFHSSFARGMGVNVLAANLHLPLLRFQGSGVYTPQGKGASFYYDNRWTSPGKLVVSDVEVIRESRAVRSQRLKGDGSYDYTLNRFISQGSERTGSLGFPSNRGFANAESSAKEIDIDTGGEEFYASIEEDLYTMKLLQGCHNETRVCNGAVCCYAKHEIEDCHSKSDDLFAIAVFDGMHTVKGNFYLQNCLLIKCSNRFDKYSCGNQTFYSDTRFKSLYLQGWFQTEYVFPQVLLSNGGQLELAKASAWNFTSHGTDDKHNTVIQSPGFGKPVLSASLVGRRYDRDPNVTDTKKLRVDEDNTQTRTKGIDGFLHNILTMFYTWITYSTEWIFG